MPHALPIEELLPLTAVAVTLRFVAEARPGFFHQPALSALLRGLLDSPEGFDTHLTLDTAESGRLHYRAGDRYRFVVFGFAGSDQLMRLLFERLRGLPHNAPRAAGGAVFGPNLALVETHDLFENRRVESVDQLSQYDAQRLAFDTAFWSMARNPRLRWLSPVRLLLDKEARNGRRNESRYCHDATDLTPELLTGRLHDSLASLLRRRGLSVPRRSAPGQLEPGDRDLFWIDTNYHRKDGSEQPMGGMMGLIDIPLPPQTDALFWRAWVIGQYLGIGQRRAFGWGRYRLETADGQFNLPTVLPMQSLLERAAVADNLAGAHTVIQNNVREARQKRDASTCGLDEEPDDELIGERLDKLGAGLSAGDYAPASLRGVIIRDPDGGVRALAVPPFFDRVAQRAVAQVLVPGLETLFNRGSFGYRPNRSRQQVARAIERAYADGFRWVFESDVDDFFDSVKWRHLRNRLQALYRDDPLIDLIIGWMSVPVTYRDRLIERDAGLPQGAPLSPLMANLMLDDFDHDLEQQGFKLLRFADDFVVLCKDENKARQAAAVAAASLNEIGLALNEDKTKITAFDQGFRYLGYLFVRSLALDIGGSRAAKVADTSSVLPPASWLARLADREPAPLDSATRSLPTTVASRAQRDTQIKANGLTKVGEATRARGTMLYVTGTSTMLSSRDGRVQVERDGEKLASAPWPTLRGILLLGAHHITTPALRRAMGERIPVHFATGGGRYKGVIWAGQPADAGHALWLRQSRFFADAEKALNGAVSVVSARLRHMREHIRQRTTQRQHDANIESLERSLRKTERAATLAELNGIEGNATRSYFQALKDFVPADLGFGSRTRRPPRDPFNALLSFGYTILYCHVETVLRVSGLLPWSGFYHQPHGRHATLASDLMEPFRHLVERTALAAVNRNSLTAADFSLDSRGGCRISDMARRKYLAMLVKRFDTPTRALGADEAMTMHEHLEIQNRNLIGWIDGSKDSFEAWRHR